MKSQAQVIYERCVALCGELREYKGKDFSIENYPELEYTVSHKEVGSFTITKKLTEEVWDAEIEDWVELPKVWYHFDGYYHPGHREVTETEALEILGQ